MSKGWVRVREAAVLLSVSESTIRRRITECQLRGRTGNSGRREVFLPAKLRAQVQNDPPPAPVSQSEQKQKPQKRSQLQTDLSVKADHAVDVQERVASTPAVSQNDSKSQPDNEDLVKRYERLAGGSLVLAQKRSDELTHAADAAYENLAHTRAQLRQVRKLAVVGWGTSGVALIVAFILSLSLGVSSARSQAVIDANQHALIEAAQRAQVLSEKLAQAQRDQGDRPAAQALVEPE